MEKSREIWLKEGDKNTKFFHKWANGHRRRNFLAKIKVNGEWLLGESDINIGANLTFHHLLSDVGKCRPKVNGISFRASNW